MNIKKSGYAGWNNYPVYTVSGFQDWLDIIGWMRENSVEHFLLSSGSQGYTFQVKSNQEWFALRWAQ